MFESAVSSKISNNLQHVTHSGLSSCAIAARYFLVTERYASIVLQLPACSNAYPCTTLMSVACSVARSPLCYPYSHGKLGLKRQTNTPRLLSISATHSTTLANAGTIEGKLELPESTQKNLAPLSTTLITLNDGEYSTYSTSTNSSFSFHNIPPGVHLLNVHSTQAYHFSQIKIQILEGEDPKCIEYYYAGATKSPISHPLTLYANAQYEYFQSRPSFALFSLFKNPMVLIMIFSVGMMVVMPQMMQNLDPEQKEQMKKQMEMQSDPTKMLSALWGEVSGAGSKEITEKKVVRKERLQRE